MKKKAAVICASGIGDGLLMMIAAHQLEKGGYEVTVFHDQKNSLSSLFKTSQFELHPPYDSLEKRVREFDLLLVENDHSKRAYALFSFRDEKKLKNIIFFFPTPSKKKRDCDFLFNPKLPVASNIVKGCEKALYLKHVTKENGLSLPKEGSYRKYSNRIVIHPTSNDKKRNWRASQFLRLAKKLMQEGFSTAFALSPEEREEWLFVEKEGAFLPSFKSLAEVAHYIYESGTFIGNDSGLGHLASNLKIPTLTISGNPKRVRLWRPDWFIGEVVTLPFPLPNFKGIHLPLRENFWQYFISVRRTLNAFHQLKKREHYASCCT